ncbi:hypothetical protein GOP47_0030233 [Adiantum capillus-veneris]|nr:hypothetical protein GOP47_0030233 [Adiantum capillus-veneris]
MAAEGDPHCGPLLARDFFLQYSWASNPHQFPQGQATSEAEKFNLHSQNKEPVSDHLSNLHKTGQANSASEPGENTAGQATKERTSEPGENAARQATK